MVSAMNDLPPPPTPDPGGDRREQIAERTRYLRGVGIVGAVAALGVFTGLAATHGGTSSNADGVRSSAPAQRGDDGSEQSDLGGFFDAVGGAVGIAPGGGGAPSVSSRGS
jgi:hypothetical protein